MIQKLNRRKQNRLPARLPVEFRVLDGRGAPIGRSVCRDVCAGGVCFDTDRDDISVGASLAVDLFVPPGDGHYPYPGRVRGEGQVIRVETLAEGNGDAGRPTRRIVARFVNDPELQF